MIGKIKSMIYQRDPSIEFFDELHKLIEKRWNELNNALCIIAYALNPKWYMERCNVPILGHYNFTECYAYQSSQIGVTESSRDIEGFYWARLASFIIMIHSAQLGFGFFAFRRFP
jgi:hypothetical protein